MVEHVQPSCLPIYFMAYSHNSVYILITTKQKKKNTREGEREREGPPRV